jgi:hypothetical protein
MTHYYLRFPDEATALAALATAELLADDGRPITASHSHALDAIGPLWVGGRWDEEGEQVEAPVLLEGWHLNYIGELPDGWEQYLVQPRQPKRVFL